jgi:hypothetical protein
VSSYVEECGCAAKSFPLFDRPKSGYKVGAGVAFVKIRFERICAMSSDCLDAAEAVSVDSHVYSGRDGADGFVDGRHFCCVVIVYRERPVEAFDTP